MNRRILLIILVLSCFTSVFAQQNKNNDKVKSEISFLSSYDGMSLLMDDSSEVVLPSLSVLIENSRNSAQVMYYQTQKDADDRELKSIRRKWMEYIKLSASYQYGVTNSFLMYQESGIVVPPNDRYSNQSQSFYLLGAGLSIPLTEIFDRGNRIKKQKIVTKEKDYQAQMWHDEQAIKIIECYTQAMENIIMIKPLIEDYTIANAQYAVSEVDFVQGKLSIQELNKQKTTLAKSKYEMEKNKTTLLRNLLKLEVLSNTKIISDKGNF